jgi:hypothetical protein
MSRVRIFIGGAVLIVVTMLLLAFPGCRVLPAMGLQFVFPPFYVAAPTSARVVDKETGEPLADVIVVAHWELEPVWGEGSPRGQMEVLETVTGPDGTFALPGWGPRLRRTPLGYLGGYAPALVLFRPAYDYASLENSGTGFPDLRIWRRSEWTNREIALRPMPDDPQVEREFLFSLDTSLSFAKTNCWWRKFPRMLLALDAASRQLQARWAPRGPTLKDWDREILARNLDESCGGVPSQVVGSAKR